MARPLPHTHAQKLQNGTRRKGKDGLYYEVVVDKAGVYCWKLTDTSKKHVIAPCKKTGRVVRLVIRPVPHRIDTDYDYTAFNPLELGSDTLGSVYSLKVLWRSVKSLSFKLEANAKELDNPKGALFYVQDVKWDISQWRYFIDVCTLSPIEYICDNSRSIYGKVGADTWMESDIRVKRNVELWLDLEECKELQRTQRAHRK